MRTAFIRALLDLADKDKSVFLLVGDMGYSVVEPFAEKYPERFLNVGVAEQNMIGVAAGLALSGKTVFVYSLGNFPTFRCLEQIRLDLCYHEANVKIVAVGGGVTYGTHGITHQATEDLAVLRALPNMTVVAPGDPVEAGLATKAAGAYKGPVYIRLGKRGETVVHQQVPEFVLGKGIILRQGKDISLIATGNMLATAIDAADLLSAGGIEAQVISMHTVEPLDQELIYKTARETKIIVTIEEHGPRGGLYGAVAEVLAKAPQCQVILTGLNLGNHSWKEIGSQKYLCHLAGLDKSGIVATVKRVMGKALPMDEQK